MQYGQSLIEEKRKVLTLMNKKIVKLSFSNLTSVLDNNLYEPRWMDVYVWIYKCKLPSDAIIFNILLEKLSSPILRFYFNVDDKRYVTNANEFLISRYLWYLITKDETPYYMETQYIPKREYIKEILKFNRFFDSGIYLKNIDENKFVIKPTEYEFDNTEGALSLYNKFLDAYDIYRSIKLSNKNFIEHINTAFEYGKDKRLIATLSNILSYFNIDFVLCDDYITMPGTDFKITCEKDGDRFQSRIIDAYQFFRNVVNTENKKDVVSEVYNRKISEDIRKEFEEGVVKYLKVTENQDLIDWIVTISKESRYTLNITFDEQGVFYIDGDIITNAADAKDYYINYMDNKKEKLAMAIYKGGLFNKIRNIWNKFKTKFAKA